MAEIMSQSQIDALLSEISSGDVDVETVQHNDVQKIKDYDFKSPKKFTKEQFKIISGLHESFARYISSYFSGILRGFAEIEVMSIEEQRYYEYYNSLPENVLIGMIDLKPVDESVEEMTLMLDLNSTIGYYTIDRLLGGSGENSNLERDFTEIEIGILKTVFLNVNKHFGDAWKSNIDINSELRKIETNSRLMQAYMPDDTVVIIALKASIEKLESNITVCIPAIELESILNSFNTSSVSGNKRKQNEDDEMKKQFVLDSVKKSQLEVKAVLDQIELDVNDIMSLKINDIIPLNQNINDQIEIHVANEVWFKGNIGQTKIRKAVKINKTIDERGN